MVQHRGAPLADSIFGYHELLQGSKAGAEFRFSLQAAGGEAMTVIKGRIIVHHTAHATQSVFSDLLIAQGLSLPINWTKDGKGRVLAAKASSIFVIST